MERKIETMATKEEEEACISQHKVNKLIDTLHYLTTHVHGVTETCHGRRREGE